MLMICICEQNRKENGCHVQRLSRFTGIFLRLDARVANVVGGNKRKISRDARIVAKLCGLAWFGSTNNWTCEKSSRWRIILLAHHVTSWSLPEQLRLSVISSIGLYAREIRMAS